MSEFSLKFRGVRGSYPISSKDFLEYGGNTACVEVNVGGHLIILDAGTGMISVGDELMEKYITSGFTPEERTPVRATVLLSHIHQDHIQGFTFFRPLHLKSTVLSVFGSVCEEENLSDELSNVLFGKTFPLDLGDIAGKLDIKNITSNDLIILRHGSEPIICKSQENILPDDVVISCYKSYAHPQDGVMIYKIYYKGKSVVYATDKESYLGGDKKLVDFARNCDVLIHDAQYTTEDYLNQYSPKQGYGHSTFDMAVEAQRQSNAGKLVFFHFEPGYDDEKLNRINEHYSQKFPDNVIMAKEGLQLEIL